MNGKEGGGMMYVIEGGGIVHVSFIVAVYDTFKSEIYNTQFSLQ